MNDECERGLSPLFCCMITKQKIEELVAEKIADTDQFVVDITVGSGNQISVEVDSLSGMSVKDYVSISRHIEGSFDREFEDFSLQVSSPGVGQSYKVPQQYQKNVGREVLVRTNEGKEVKGKMIDFRENEIYVEVKEKRKVEGKKSKQLVEEIITIQLEDIKETKTEISFK